MDLFGRYIYICSGDGELDQEKLMRQYKDSEVRYRQNSVQKEEIRYKSSSYSVPVLAARTIGLFVSFTMTLRAVSAETRRIPAL